MTRIMNSDVAINRLLEMGVIVRVNRGWYRIPRHTEAGEMQSYQHPYTLGMQYRRDGILSIVANEVEPGRFRFKADVVRSLLPLGARIPEARRPRTIRRNSYHSESRNISSALHRINNDMDGIRRSYGIEYEINALTPQQETDLAYLLDTLPAHITERDGSLLSSGVEIIFEPLGRRDAIQLVKTLAAFVREQGINMNNTGMHITFGVSNSTTNLRDLTIRLNRLALAVKSVGLQGEIIRLFGRDFTSFASLQTDLNSSARHRAFSVRNVSAWEARLVRWDCDIDRIMQFFDIAEPLFHRPLKQEDFLKVFALLGSRTE